MNTLTSEAWVCLLDKKTLQELIEKRQRIAKQKNDWFSGKLHEKLWRQIRITSTPEGIKLSLMNVNEEAVNGGYWSGGDACVDYKFTWEDLNDNEFIDGLLNREQVVVYRKAMEMLTTLKARAVPMREALQEL